jgi:thioredoxin 1
MSKTNLSILLAAMLFLLPHSVAAAEAVPEVPTKGMVTMVDLGAKACIPCKMMAPVLDEVEKEYRGKAAVVFIDVWKDHDQIARFGITAIPTQIFYDRDGKETTRHTGFMDKQAIRQVLDQLLAR